MLCGPAGEGPPIHGPSCDPLSARGGSTRDEEGWYTGSQHGLEGRDMDDSAETQTDAYLAAGAALVSSSCHRKYRMPWLAALETS